MAESIDTPRLDYLIAHPDSCNNASPNAIKLAAIRDKVIAGLSQGLSYRKLSDALKADGVSVSPETLRRHMAPFLPKGKRGKRRRSRLPLSSTQPPPPEVPRASATSDISAPQSSSHAAHTRANRRP